MTDTFRVALAGNPNTGKSTIFNALTGANQHVGNWPGKTVVRRSGWFVHRDTTFEVVDLPGTYSLSAFSPDEEVARDYIVRTQPDLVVNVLDVTNLERNLYLTAQILETNAPLLLVLNMQDLAQRRGYRVDYEKLSQLLGGVPIVPAAAAKGDGIGALRDMLWHLLQHVVPNETPINSLPGENDHVAFCPHCRAL
ncbi:MAG: 50S ribosome-binding GTPase [Anaerolineales bacterium]|nr:50S ribosome-binding GTPase [Anaerolineales bacterium]